MGFIVDQQQEMIWKERAAQLLQQVVACMRDSGATAGAERLERGGYPGHEDLEHYARTFGVAFLVSPNDAEAFPVICGDGPIGFEVRHCYSRDGEGHSAGHFQLNSVPTNMSPPERFYP